SVRQPARLRCTWSFLSLGQWSVIKNRVLPNPGARAAGRGSLASFPERDCCIAQIHCRDGKRPSQGFFVATHNPPFPPPPAKIKRSINQRVIMVDPEFPGRRMTESPRIIKKYPNRRLYDTANSGYITLADVKQMVLDNIDFQVIDAKTGEDLARAILLQIILEEEAGGMPMFSSEMLAQMIRFYGSAQQTIMGSYIEQNVKAFMAIQKKLQDQAKQIYGDKMMLTPDLWKQFMQMQAPAMQ